MTEDEMAGWHHQLYGVSLSELWELVMDREEEQKYNFGHFYLCQQRSV